MLQRQFQLVLMGSFVVHMAGAAKFALAEPGSAPKPPVTKTIDHKDTYHGTVVADPYRWLEGDVRTEPEVAKWVEAQNAVTFEYLKSLPARNTIRERLTRLWNFERFSAPFKEGGRYFYFRNDGLQNQAVLYVQETLDSPARILIDPNTWSKDGTIALDETSFSDDGRYVAYGVQDAGSDWKTWRILEISTGKLLEEELKWIKFSEPAWTADGQGLYYSRFPEPKPGAEFQNLNLNQKIYYHRIGTKQSEDRLVLERPDHPDWGFGPAITDDGRYLVVTVWIGTDDRYRIFYRDLSAPEGPFVELIDHFDDEYTLIGNSGTWFYFKTDRNAPKKRVIAIDIRQPAVEHWKEIVPQRNETLTSVSLVNDSLILAYLKDAKTEVSVCDLTGNPIRKVELPGIGTAAGFQGKPSDRETFYSFSSFATPPSTYRYDLVTGESHKLRQAEVDFQPGDYEVEQVFYQSKDGTRVPMFLAYRRGLKRDGNNRTLLYGYGGFNISLTPSFSVSRLAWMEMGGVLAIANLRGGGEYGEEWHQGGTKTRKQNVFDDFIAAAEYLVKNNYTKPQALAIQGGSNGGLLVGACMTQRPDLFGAALPAVGVMDMLRFHQFTAGRYWVDDFGSADNPEEFKSLRAYSPYHNIKPGVSYPATLITTADTDDRVVPGHSFKFAAALQQAHTGTSPVLIRIETRAGHGAGKPTSKIIEEAADLWAFLMANLKT